MLETMEVFWVKIGFCPSPPTNPCFGVWDPLEVNSLSSGEYRYIYGLCLKCRPSSIVAPKSIEVSIKMSLGVHKNF
jgi:hypothetical protein